MEKYILGQSKEGVINKNNSEVRLDISLQPNKYYDCVIVYGKVQDLCKNPINDAKVVCYDKNYKVINKVFTFNQGCFICNGIKKYSLIRIAVIKAGYKDYLSNFIHINSNNKKVCITLLKQCITKYALLTGHIFDEKGEPVKVIFINLIKIYDCNCSELYKDTISNEYGQFTFENVPKGIYKMIICDCNYELYEELIEIRDTQIIQKKIILKNKACI